MVRTAWAAAITAALLALSGCGGAHKSSTSTSTATSSATSGGRLTETVGVSGKGKGSGRTTATPGDTVQIKTAIAGDRTAPAQLVTVSASTGPGTALRITAKSPGHRAKAQITSADGKPLTLGEVHYECALPQTPTFCPAQHISAGAHGFTVAFMANPTTGVALSAIVGPATGLPQVPARPAGLPTAAYTPTELLRAHAPTASTGVATTSTTTTTTALTTTSGAEGTSASAGLTPAVTVVPGTRVTMVTRLTGLPGGEPQLTTITIPKGPAKTLTVSAAVSAARTSRATITRAGGGKLAVDPPQFRCALAPTPTFCPPQSVVTKGHDYVVTFMASPHSPPIAFQVRVRPA